MVNTATVYEYFDDADSAYEFHGTKENGRAPVMSASDLNHLADVLGFLHAAVAHQRMSAEVDVAILLYLWTRDAGVPADEVAGYVEERFKELDAEGNRVFVDRWNNGGEFSDETRRNAVFGIAREWATTIMQAPDLSPKTQPDEVHPQYPSKVGT